MRASFKPDGFRGIGFYVDFDASGKLVEYEGNKPFDLPHGWCRYITEVVSNGQGYRVHYRDVEIIRWGDLVQVGDLEYK